MALISIIRRRGIRRGEGKYGIAPKSQRTLDGLLFASKGEMQRWAELLILERAGEISHLCRQIPFSIDVNGVHICRYFADFQYRTRGGSLVTEDWKGYRTPAYRLKKKLMLAVHGIAILEMEKGK